MTWGLTYFDQFTCMTPESQKQSSGNQKNRRIRPKPPMILYVIQIGLFSEDNKIFWYLVVTLNTFREKLSLGARLVE